MVEVTFYDSVIAALSENMLSAIEGRMWSRALEREEERWKEREGVIEKDERERERMRAGGKERARRVSRTEVAAVNHRAECPALLPWRFITDREASW